MWQGLLTGCSAGLVNRFHHNDPGQYPFFCSLSHSRSEANPKVPSLATPVGMDSMGTAPGPSLYSLKDNNHPSHISILMFSVSY